MKNVIFIFVILVIINIGLIYLVLNYKNNIAVFRTSCIGMICIDGLVLFALYACIR